MPKTIWEPAALLAPVPPALVTCGTQDHPNILTVAWCGIVNSRPAMTYVSIRPERFSHDIIRRTGEFVINLTTEKLVRAADLCGVKSGRDTDKFALCGLSALPSAKVSAPSLEQSPVSLECRVTQILPLGTHDMFLAEIAAVCVDEQYIDRSGRFHMERCGLAAYCHGQYYSLGEPLGSFGFSVRKKRSRKPRR